MKMQLDFVNQMNKSNEDEIEQLKNHNKKLRMELDNIERIQKNEKFEKN